MGRLSPAAVRVTIGALLLAASALGQNADFKVDVRLVRVVATVKDGEGKTVGGLNKEDFSIADNGVKQAIAIFERHTSQPLSVSILIDNSGSTGKEMKYQVESVHRFLGALFRQGNPQDHASLVSFNFEVRQLVDFSRNISLFDRKLRSLRGEAGTSLYDALYLSSQNLQDREGRRVMIVVTDGADTVSSKNYQEALRAAHDTDVVVYGVLVMPITNEAGRHIAGEHALTGISQSTGGKMFTPGYEQIDAAFDEILRDLRTQYLLGFYSKGVPITKEPFHQLDVRVAQPGLRVVCRTGYYGDIPATSR